MTSAWVQQRELMACYAGSYQGAVYKQDRIYSAKMLTFGLIEIVRILFVFWFNKIEIIVAISAVFGQQNSGA